MVNQTEEALNRKNSKELCLLTKYLYNNNQVASGYTKDGNGYLLTNNLIKYLVGKNTTQVL